MKYKNEVYSFLSYCFGYPTDERDINNNVLNKLKRDLAKELFGHVFAMARGR